MKPNHRGDNGYWELELARSHLKVSRAYHDQKMGVEGEIRKLGFSSRVCFEQFYVLYS